MYNSFIVQVLVRIWKVLVTGYDNSFLKIFNDRVKKGIKFLSKGSYTTGLFTSDRSLIEESLLYDLYSKVINLINRIISWLKKVINKASSGSVIHTTVYSLFSDEVKLMNTFYIFFIAFGTGIIINNLVKGFYAGKSYTISILLIFVSFIGLSIGKNYREMLKESYAFQFIKSIFTVDEGVDQWW